MTRGSGLRVTWNKGKALEMPGPFSFKGLQ
jgi:hypothetical protein